MQESESAGGSTQRNNPRAAQAPEIDPASAASGLTLPLGGGRLWKVASVVCNLEAAHNKPWLQIVAAVHFQLHYSGQSSAAALGSIPGVEPHRAAVGLSG